jgi:CubicO group peptidase (beta-lactamase class C family)
MNPTRILAALWLLSSGAGLATAAGSSTLVLPHSTPEEQGVSSSAVLGFVEAAEQRMNGLHSFVLMRHGHVVAEGWWAPYGAEEPHMLYSLSKSFTSTAVGLAISEGKLSLYDPVVKFFPESAPADPSKNLSAMRVRDLLRMSSGQLKEDIDKFPFGSQEDLVKVFLAMPVPFKPGTHFVYNTEATYMLSAIVQKVTGQTVLDYLRPRLFEPLGIANPAWEASAQGVSFGGFGLSIRTEDIARLGQLFLQKGKWQGAQLVPESWVEAATSLQTSNGSNPDSDWDQGYGYQFWRCKHGFYRGDGAFGQLCIVMPEYDAVLAVTAGTGDMQAELNTVWDKIIPAFASAPLPADPQGDTRLAEKLAGLNLPAQAGPATSPVAAKVAGKRYVFPQNPNGIESLVYNPSGDGSGYSLTVRTGGADQRIGFGSGTWTKGSYKLGPGDPVAAAASGAWTGDDTLTVVLCEYRTPYIFTDRARFTGDEVELTLHANVGFNDGKDTVLKGKLQP